MILDKKQLYTLSKSKITIGFGAGITADKTLHVVQDSMQYFVDNEKKLWGQTFQGCAIYSPDKLKEFDKDKIFIIICTTFYAEVKEQLENMGYEMGIHFGYSPLLKSIVAYEKLSQGSTKLLVSAYGTEGGLYILNTRNGASEKVHDGNFRGIKYIREKIYAVKESEGIYCLDANTLEIENVYELENFTNALGIAYCEKQSLFYIAISGRDEILVVDSANMKETERIPFSNKFNGNKKEHHHLNDLLLFEDSLLVSMFSQSGFWRQNIYDGCLIEYDLKKKQIINTLMSGLVKPHTIKLFEDDIYLIDSFRGLVMRGCNNIMAEFNGFIRGLEKDSSRYYIGQSKNRHIEESYRNKKAIMSNCGVIIYLEDDKVYRLIDIPHVNDIYDIIDLTKDGN